MNTKIIEFDLNKELYGNIVAKQGDTESRFLLFKLLDGAIPFNLTNRSVRVYGLKKDGTEIFNDLIVNNATKGYCTLELTNQMLAIAGEVKLELMIIEGDKKLTSNVFTLEVRKSINSEKAIVSTNEFTALLKGLASLNEYDNYKNEIKEARGGQTKLKDRLDKFGSSLEQTAINLSNSIENNYNELDNKINSQASGSPKGVFSTIDDLENDINANTLEGKKYIYVVAEDGNWYYWNGIAWTNGGVYQGRKIEENSIGLSEINNELIEKMYVKGSKNKINKKYLFDINSDNLISEDILIPYTYVFGGVSEGITKPSGTTTGWCTDFLPVDKNINYYFYPETVATGTSLTGCRYDSNFNYIDDIYDTDKTGIINSGEASYIRLNLYIVESVGLRAEYNYLTTDSNYKPQTANVGEIEGLNINHNQINSLKMENLPSELINNLVDFDKITVNKYINSIGNLIDSTSLSVSDYIRVNEGEIIYFKVKYGSAGYGFTYDKKRHSNLVLEAYDDIYKLVVPKGMYYIRVNIANTQYTSYYINRKGKVDVTSNFNEPTNLNYTRGTLPSHKIQGFKTVNLFYKEERVLNSYINSVGNIVESTEVDTAKIIIEGYNKIYMSHKLATIGYFFDINGTKISLATSTDNLNENGLYVVEVPQNAYYIIINVSKPYTDAFFINGINESTDPNINVKLPYNLESNILSKNIMCGGDSITARNGVQVEGVTLNGIQYYLTKSGANVSTVAVGGSTIRKYDESISTGGFHDSAYSLIVENELNIYNIDVFIFFWGTNDSSRGFNLGNTNSREANTTLGAFRLCMEYLMKKNPKMRIVVVTPLFSRAGGHGLENLKLITNGMIEICEEYRIDYINSLKEITINSFNIDLVTLDKLHPNNDGYSNIAKKIVNKVV